MRTTFARNSDAYRWTGSGNLERVNAGTSRVDYNPTDGSLSGLLIADQITNTNAVPASEWQSYRGSKIAASTSGLGVSASTARVTAGPDHSDGAGIQQSGGVGGSANQTSWLTFFVRVNVGSTINVTVVGGVGINVDVDVDALTAGPNGTVISVGGDAYWAAIPYIPSSAFGASGNAYFRIFGAGALSDGTPLFDLWGLNQYVSPYPRPDFLPGGNGATTVAADYLNAPAGDWLPTGRHTWRGSVRMSADPGQPTILGHSGGRIYASGGRLLLDGPGRLWQPDGEHAPGSLVPFYWTVELPGAAPDFTVGRAVGDTDWWNSHLIDIVPYPRVISETDIREALGV